MKNRFKIMAWVERLQSYEIVKCVPTWREVETYPYKGKMMVLDTVMWRRYEITNLSIKPMF